MEMKTIIDVVVLVADDEDKNKKFHVSTKVETHEICKLLDDGNGLYELTITESDLDHMMSSNEDNLLIVENADYSITKIRLSNKARRK